MRASCVRHLKESELKQQSSISSGVLSFLTVPRLFIRVLSIDSYIIGVVNLVKNTSNLLARSCDDVVLTLTLSFISMSYLEWAESQLAEIELLTSMFPTQEELEMTDQLALAELRNYVECSDSTDCPPTSRPTFLIKQMLDMASMEKVANRLSKHIAVIKMCPKMLLCSAFIVVVVPLRWVSSCPVPIHLTIPMCYQR